MSWKSIIKSFIWPLLIAIVGGFVGGPLWDFIKTAKQPKVMIVKPADGQHISVPLDLVMKYKNLPAENYICAFIQGSAEHLYYPLLSFNSKTNNNSRGW